MKPRKKRFYVVWAGHKTGVFSSWDECQRATQGYSNAKFKSFASKNDALAAFKQSPESHLGQESRIRSGSDIKKTTPHSDRIRFAEPNLDSIAVDAACSGNPGLMEYQGVDTRTGEPLFHKGPFEQGTNNIGEFLALVHGLAYLKQRDDNRLIYSDSKIAIGWVHKKSCRTKLPQNGRTKRLFDLIRRAENWLKNNEFNTEIRKWETEQWGEIPADFGRK